jgi:FkbH-like protein
VKFLEARRVLSEFSRGQPLNVLLAMSGSVGSLDTFVRAEAARRGYAATVRTLPFNTLAQALIRPANDEREIFVLFPWDLAPSLDWRTGLPDAPFDLASLMAESEQTLKRLGARTAAAIYYCPAILPPVGRTTAETSIISRRLLATALAVDASLLDEALFDLPTYLATGCPFSGTTIGDVAHALAANLDATPVTAKKLLVTDFDNVLWHGVIGEDGIDGIKSAPDGIGFKHFIYQTLLVKLEKAGVLVAGVTRNDEDLARAPFRNGSMRLAERDLVAIVASYKPKSAQIRQLADQLNLGLDSVVFVDDNPVELAEVSRALPAVTCVAFPEREHELSRLLDELSSLFPIRTVTTEDRERTELYRRRVASMPPSDADGADLRSFLLDLEMRLTIHDRSAGDRTRAVQLINKTNQFNLNGRRVTDEEVARTLAAGGRLFTATLSDRHGTHGEILACLIDARGAVDSYVMSCRVFQRRVEHAFTAWLVRTGRSPAVFRHASTERNEPIRLYLAGAGFAADADGSVRFDAPAFVAAHGDALDLFALTVE